MTYDSKILIEAEFNKNFNQSLNYLKKLGIDIGGVFKIWLSTPCIGTGHYIENNNISWAFRNDWGNYNTVYLWHEILHSRFIREEYTHALIEFITDEQLRKHLGGTDYPPFNGHKKLENFKVLALPIWNAYLDSEDHNIIDLEDKFKNLYFNSFATGF